MVKLKSATTFARFSLFLLTNLVKSGSSVQFKMVCMRSEKPICAPPCLSEVSTMSPLTRLTDDGPLSSFQGRSSSASSFHASLSSMRSMVLYPWFCTLWQCLKLLNTLGLPRSKPFVRVALPASLSARSLLFTPACPGKYTHRSFRRWISTIDKIKSAIQCIASLYYLWQNAIIFSPSGFCFVVVSVLFCFSVLNFTVLSDLYVSFRMICHFALCTTSLSNYR